MITPVARCLSIDTRMQLITQIWEDEQLMECRQQKLHLYNILWELLTKLVTAELMQATIASPAAELATITKWMGLEQEHWWGMHAWSLLDNSTRGYTNLQELIQCGAKAASGRNLLLSALHFAPVVDYVVTDFN